MLYLNNETKPFNDVAFRQALNMVVDRADISKTAGYGVWPEITSVTGLPQPSGDAFISDDVRRPGAHGRRRRRQGRSSTDAGLHLGRRRAGRPRRREGLLHAARTRRGWTDYLDALGIIGEGAAALGAEATVERVVQDTWFNDIIPFGNFQASLHWTDGGSTPWNMYSNIMDGASYVPLGETATWNFGRYKNDEVTAGAGRLQGRHLRRGPPARRSTSSSRRFVEEVPGLVIWSRPAVAQYSTVNYTGFPTDEDPYANPQPTGPQAALILSKLVPTK